MSIHEEAAKKSGENVRSLFGADARAILAASQEAVAVAEATQTSEKKHHEIVLEKIGLVDDKIEAVREKLQKTLDAHEVELVVQQGQAKQARDAYAQTERRLRGDVAELKQLIGQPPPEGDLARASFRDMTREEIERVEKGFGLRGQVAFLVAQAKAQRRVTRWVAVGGVAFALAELAQATLKLLEVLR